MVFDRLHAAADILKITTYSTSSLRTLRSRGETSGRFYSQEKTKKSVVDLIEVDNRDVDLEDEELQDEELQQLKS